MQMLLRQKEQLVAVKLQSILWKMTEENPTSILQKMLKVMVPDIAVEDLIMSELMTQKMQPNLIIDCIPNLHQVQVNNAQVRTLKLRERLNLKLMPSLVIGMLNYKDNWEIILTVYISKKGWGSALTRVAVGGKHWYICLYDSGVWLKVSQNMMPESVNVRAF